MTTAASTLVMICLGLRIHGGCQGNVNEALGFKRSELAPYAPNDKAAQDFAKIAGTTAIGKGTEYAEEEKRRFNKLKIQTARLWRFLHPVFSKLWPNEYAPTVMHGKVQGAMGETDKAHKHWRNILRDSPIEQVNATSWRPNNQTENVRSGVQITEHVDNDDPGE